MKEIGRQRGYPPRSAFPQQKKEILMSRCSKRALEEVGGNRRKVRRPFFVISCFAAIASVLLCSVTARCGEVDELAAKAEFIFKGTLQKASAVTMVAVPVTDKTVVVKVDEILQGPESLRDFTGKEVTVQLIKPTEMKVGDQAIFFTNGWLYGEGLAVVEVGRPANAERATGQALTAQNEEVTKAIGKLGDRDLRKRVASSNLIVVGKVVSVKPSEVMAAATQATGLSEHDPQFLEASIQVEKTEKGTVSGNTVKVVFPSSMDVMWHKAPKLKLGQEGAFILHTGEAQKVSGVAGLPEVYSMLEPTDFQPKGRQEQLRKVIQSVR
jgi:hypothetical protein